MHQGSRGTVALGAFGVPKNTRREQGLGCLQLTAQHSGDTTQRTQSCDPHNRPCRRRHFLPLKIWGLRAPARGHLVSKCRAPEPVVFSRASLPPRTTCSSTGDSARASLVRAQRSDTEALSAGRGPVPQHRVCRPRAAAGEALMRWLRACQCPVGGRAAEPVL